jgi:hypothetical protein
MIQTRGGHFKGEYASMLPLYADPDRAGINVKSVVTANDMDDLVGLMEQLNPILSA